MKLDSCGNYNPWVQPEYGFDAADCPISAPEGYKLVKFNTKLKLGDIPFDVYDRTSGS
jgi:hypothetical protein